MVALNFNTDPTNTGQSDSTNNPVTPGKYLGEVVDVSIRESQKKPENSYLSVEWKLENDRHVWSNFNLWNTNTTAVEMATKELNALAVALMMPKIADTDDLLLKQAVLDIGIQSNNPQYNEVLGFEKVSAQHDFADTPAPTPAPVQTGAPQPQAEPAPAGNKPPWG